MNGCLVAGTGSDVGKSFVATAICRMLADRGLSVAPFKAQNMSNNAGVTRSGHEMARAQVVQAEAARVEPHPDMNPVLIKPMSEKSAAVILNGRPIGTHDAMAYFRDTSALRREAMAALDRLRQRYPVIVAEGAGSCAEVNLRARDFTNLDVAHHARLPTVLVADIDRGGVFAQVVGTLAVLDDRDRSLIKGVIVNRFRGDQALFADGARWIEETTGLPVLGVLPWDKSLNVESEDALPPGARVDPPVPLSTHPERLRIAIPLAPHMANFTDFGPLELHSEIEVHWLSRPRALVGYDLVVLAGSRNTRGDLDHFWRSGWAQALRDWEDRRIIGVCGGYQMLGREVADPLGVEGAPGATRGLGLLDVSTIFEADKRVGPSHGRWGQVPLRGYEIHHGRTVRHSGQAPVTILSRPEGAVHEDDGAVSSDGRCWGSYLHGLFDQPQALAAMLAEVRPDLDLRDMASRPPFDVAKEAIYDRVAAHFAGHVDVGRMIDALE